MKACSGPAHGRTAPREHRIPRSTYLCQQACDEGKLTRVLPQWHAKADPIHIVYPQQRFLPPRLRAFVDLALQELRKWL